VAAVELVVVMGVAGAGKTTVGRALADRLGATFVDADTLHTPADRAQMAAGTPLTDAQRDAWMDRVLDAVAEARPTVLACSALRRVHRAMLYRSAEVRLFFLAVPEPELERRLATRPRHFFPPSLLETQFRVLDPPGPGEPVTVVDADRPVNAVVDAIVASLGAAAAPDPRASEHRRPRPPTR
jgi:gluconokinase